jgi:Rrf2 family protein
LTTILKEDYNCPILNRIKIIQIMQITRQTDYAIRCVLYLSRHKDHIIMSDAIADEMSIPKSFVAKILQRLAKGGIVKSFRGIKGGFQLAKKAKEITLFDVIDTIQGPTAMNRCAVDKYSCRFRDACTVHPVWVKLRRKVEEYLRKVTFEKLAKARRTKKKSSISSKDNSRDMLKQTMTGG